jgi:bacteriorhodopsin
MYTHSYSAQEDAAPAAQKEGYRHLQSHAYGDAAAAGDGTCPCGSVDTRDYRVNNNVILWVAFGLLFLPGLWFIYKGFEVLNLANGSWNNVRMQFGLVNLVASLAYLTMALGHGFVTKCNGRDFYYARYVDWMVTTPIMIYDFVEMSHGNGLTQTFLVLMDIFMIVAGLIGELVDGQEKWAFFAFSMLAFIPVMWFLCSLAHDETGGLSGICGTSSGVSLTQALFKRVVAITFIAWIGYPIVWILANVTSSAGACEYAAQGGYRILQDAGVSQVGVISAQSEAYAYTVLDIVAKTLVGYLVVCFNPTEVCPETKPAYKA